MTIEKLSQLQRTWLNIRPHYGPVVLRHVDALTAENERLRACFDGHETTLAAISNENQRLRARLDNEFTHDQLLHEVSAYRSGMMAVEARLAEATALLVEHNMAAAPLSRRTHKMIDLVARTGAFLANQPAALEFDDTVRRLQAVALSHGWVLKSWGLVRANPGWKCRHHSNAMTCGECQPAALNTLALAAEVRQRVAESIVEAKRQVAALSAQPAAPSLGHPGADEVFATLQAARQPATPARTEAEPECSNTEAFLSGLNNGCEVPTCPVHGDVEPGQAIWKGECPGCLGALEVTHGDEEGQIGVLYTQAGRDKTVKRKVKARTEANPLHESWRRHEAEQAVLNAAARRHIDYDQWCAGVHVAELVRRRAEAVTEWTSKGRYPDRVSSVRVEFHGVHARLTVWWAGKLAGTLRVGEHEAIALESVLLGNVLIEPPALHPDSDAADTRDSTLEKPSCSEHSPSEPSTRST